MKGLKMRSLRGLVAPMLGVLLLSSVSWAIEIKTETTNSVNYLSAGAEFSQFAFPTGDIHGSGVRAGFSHYFDEKYDFDVFLASALGAQGSSSFTGLGGYVYY